MTTMNVHFGRRWPCFVSFWLLAAGAAAAGALTSSSTTPTDAQLADDWWPPTIITNAAQVAAEFSRPDAFYLPDGSLGWTLYPGAGDPWWVDFSQWPGLDARVRECPGTTLYGVTARRVSLTLELLTGEIVVRSSCANRALCRLPPPAHYRPDRWPVGSAPARLWQHWLAAKADPQWRENWGPVVSPLLELRVEWADWLREKPIRDWNLVAEIRAWEEAEQSRLATAPTRDGGMLAHSSLDGGGMMLLGGEPCAITNEAQPFAVSGLWAETNGGMTVAWESCSDHVYGVFSTDELNWQTVWTGRAGLWGLDGATTWTDTSAGSVGHRFYKVARMPPDGDFDGDGMPNGWEASNGLNPVDAADALWDADGDGYSNRAEYLAGTDPRSAASRPVKPPLTIPNSWAIYANSNTVQVVADIRSTNATVTVAAAEYFLDSTNGVVFGQGHAMQPQDGLFNSTNETATVTFVPAFPYGQRHELFVHAQASTGGWSDFVKVILNPNVNDILNKIEANYSAIQTLCFTLTTVQYQNSEPIVGSTATVKMKGPYKIRVDYSDSGLVAIQNENRSWWYNEELGIGGALTAGVNGDFDATASRYGDFFWDVPLCRARTDAGISNGVASATFDCSLPSKAGQSWPFQHFGTDFRKGTVTIITSKVEDLAVKSEFLNAVEVSPGHWLFTGHRNTKQFDSGDSIVVESTISNVVVNPLLSDDLFVIPEEE